jgi:predicted nuclease with TOPRIM domain
MLKLYALIIIIGILGGVGYGAKYYYDSTQATIAILRENNAQLEVAVQTAQESVETLQQDMVKQAELNNQLQKNLQKAEQYGDSLRNKLQQLDLVKDAIMDAEKLEGKMNGATAKIWRKITRDTGGDDYPIPDWLQQSRERAGIEGSDQNREDNSSSSGPAETGTTE